MKLKIIWRTNPLYFTILDVVSISEDEPIRYGIHENTRHFLDSTMAREFTAERVELHTGSRVFMMHKCTFHKDIEDNEGLYIDSFERGDWRYGNS